MMNAILVLLFCGFFASTSHASNLQDFCVADLKGPESPSGYHCLPSDTVTAQNFKYTFGKAIPMPYKAVLYPASVKEVPVLNGFGISAARGELERGGFVPVYTNSATEILILIKGQLDVGILTPERAYVNTLKPGDVTVFPKGVYHYLVNSGKEKTVSYIAYSSPNPRIKFVPEALFANNVSTKTIAQTTFLDEPQVRKLKARFNGSG